MRLLKYLILPSRHTARLSADLCVAPQYCGAESPIRLRSRALISTDIRTSRRQSSYFNSLLNKRG